MRVLAGLHVLAIAVKPSGSSSRYRDCTEAVQVACACRDVGGFGDDCNNGSIMVHSVVLGTVKSKWSRGGGCWIDYGSRCVVALATAIVRGHLCSSLEFVESVVRRIRGAADPRCPWSPGSLW